MASTRSRPSGREHARPTTGGVAAEHATKIYTVAIIGIIVAEFFTAITGLGAIIVKYGNQYDTASMFVPIFVLMFLGVMLSALLRRAEEWIAPWKTMEND